VEFERFENLLQTYAEKPKRIEDLRTRYVSGQLSFEDMFSQAESLGQADRFDYDGLAVNFLTIAKHYYLPILTSNDDKIEYIRNIIKVPSEVSFLNKLDSYLKEPGNKFSELDWWLFSRVDETCDQVNIPYYNPYENKILNFKPDFIFGFRRETPTISCLWIPKALRVQNMSIRSMVSESFLKIRKNQGNLPMGI
jgi:hypothetical protein